MTKAIEKVAVDPGSGRVFGYIRVSTDRQALSPEVQRHTIEEAARRIGRSINAWFEDAPTRNKDGSWNDAQSGKVPLPERKAGQLLCEQIRKGDVVIVAKVDRAFRKLSDCVIMLDRWERQGIGLLLCDFPMLSDLSNPFGKAMIQLVAVFAEIERKLISQRTKEALALRKRKGHANGKYPGYGMKWERRWDGEQGRYVKVKVDDPEEQSVMREIVKLRNDGHGWDAITLILDHRKVVNKEGRRWTRSRVRRAFQAELRIRADENSRRAE